MRAESHSIWDVITRKNMIEIEDKDYFIKTARLVLGVGAGLLVFNILFRFIGGYFDFTDNSIVSEKGGTPSFFRQLSFLSFIIAASAVSTLAAVAVAKPSQKLAANLVGIGTGLWFGGILWFLNFWVLLILGAMIANYFVSLRVASESPRIILRIRGLVDEIDTIQNQ